MILFEDFCRYYRKIVVWGTGGAFTNHYKKDFPIEYLVDTNQEKWGKRIFDLDICDPHRVLQEKQSETAIIICSTYGDEIYQKAREMGIKCDIFLPSMLYPNPFLENQESYKPILFDDISIGHGAYTVEKNVQILIALMKVHGIRKIIASPGATNISFVASVQKDPFFEIYSAVDERSAGYLACGLAAESGEPVALSCTGATASRNYMSALTEAYYRKLPVVVITSSQSIERIGHNIPQVTDRTALPNDIAKISVCLPIIYNAEQRWACEINTNKALLEIRHHGRGPVHINLITDYSKDFSIRALPSVKVIQRIMYTDKLPELSTKRVGIFVGAHVEWNEELLQSVNQFCAYYDAVVICDQSSNYRGKYRVLAPLILQQKEYHAKCTDLDILIHIGEISGAYMNVNSKHVWRVSPDGKIVDTFQKLQYVFEMEEIDFFERYIENVHQDIEANIDSAVYKWQQEYEKLYACIPELPFSNVWIAQQTADKLPEGSSLHLGILNTLRTWNFFETPESVLCYSNTGGFGIDGGVSACMGASLHNADKLYFGVFGDLAFFYDMNVLGNRHVANNLRIIVINNAGGTEFKNYSHRGIQVLGKDVDAFVAAGGHFGNQSYQLVRHYAEDLGFEYLSARNKEEYLSNLSYFLQPQMTEKPILFEVYTDSDKESLALKIIQSLKIDEEN